MGNANTCDVLNRDAPRPHKQETQKAVEEITKLLEAAVVAEASTKAEGASDAEARFELERRQFKQKEERLERQVMLLHEEVASLKAQLTSAKVNSQASLELAAPASSVVAAAVRDARNGSTADTALLTKPLPPKPAPAPPKPAAAQPPSPAKPPAAAPAVTAVKAATPKPAAVHPTWPVLSKGSDDIAAMAFLHRMLSEGGCVYPAPAAPPPTAQLCSPPPGRRFHCGDDDMEDWIFGEGTLNALLTFQEVNGIADTGCTDAATWLALVGALSGRAGFSGIGFVGASLIDPSRRVGARLSDACTLCGAVRAGQDAMRECPFANADTIISEKMGASSASAGAHADHGAKAGGSHHEKEKEHSSHSSGHTKHAGKWPNLRRDDGGSHVSEFHVPRPCPPPRSLSLQIGELNTLRLRLAQRATLAFRRR